MSFCYNFPYTLTDGSLVLPIACYFINVIVSVIATSADNIVISCLFYGGLLSPSLSYLLTFYNIKSTTCQKWSAW